MVNFNVRSFAKKVVPPPEFHYQDLFEQPNKVEPVWRKLTGDYVSTMKDAQGNEVLKVEPEALRLLSATAMVDIAHLLRPTHL
jgi:fumarate hydratase, class I